MFSDSVQIMIAALGCSHPSPKIVDAIVAVGAPFIETPSEIGDDYYFEFFQRGVVFNFEKDDLVQISIFLEKQNGYSEYQENIFNDGIPNRISLSKVKQAFGEPIATGGGEVSLLLGYINKWLKYDMGKYFINLEISKQDSLLLNIHLMPKIL